MRDLHERAEAVLVELAESANIDAPSRLRACELLLTRPVIASEDSNGKAAAPTATEDERAARAERMRVAQLASGGLVKRLPVGD